MELGIGRAIGQAAGQPGLVSLTDLISQSYSSGRHPALLPSKIVNLGFEQLSPLLRSLKCVCECPRVPLGIDREQRKVDISGRSPIRCSPHMRYHSSKHFMDLVDYHIFASPRACSLGSIMIATVVSLASAKLHGLLMWLLNSCKIDQAASSNPSKSLMLYDHSDEGSPFLRARSQQVPQYLPHNDGCLFRRVATRRLRAQSWMPWSYDAVRWIGRHILVFALAQTPPCNEPQL